MDLETCLNLDLDLDMADSVSVCVRHYWHQQFETSTGDKTQTGNILPGGETFVPTRWTEAEIKQISQIYQKNPKPIANQHQISQFQRIEIKHGVVPNIVVP